MLYQYLLRPILFRFDPEAVHELAVARLASSGRLVRLLRPALVYDDPILTQSLMGLTFRNPVGLAAGFDKFARAMPAWAHLGFGFCEIGTITGLPQPGNEKPRLFRLPKDRALINRFGFNNDGAEKTATTMNRWRQSPGRYAVPVGINIGKSKVVDLDHAADDYVASFKTLWPYADYFTINVSSPNTPGLRELQDRKFLTSLLRLLRDTDRHLALAAQKKGIPILVKIAPDLAWTQIDDVLRVIDDTGIDGIVATNTTVSRDDLRTSDPLRSETGGLSGKPIGARSTAIIRHIHRETRGRMMIIGVGGIFTAEDAYEKITSGASLVQVYTGFIYEGPSMCHRINGRLARLLKADGFTSIADAVGSRSMPEGSSP